MPQYLGRFSDTSDAVKVLIAKPEGAHSAPTA
jgi:hypothetical protein